MTEIPGNLPAPTPSETAESSASVKEADALGGGVDLSNKEALNARNRLDREDNKERHYHRLMMCGLYTGFFVVGCMFFVLCWHVAGPKNLRFLSDEEIGKLQTFLLSGAIGGAVTKAGRYVLPQGTKS